MKDFVYFIENSQGKWLDKYSNWITNPIDALSFKTPEDANKYLIEKKYKNLNVTEHLFI